MSMNQAMFKMTFKKALNTWLDIDSTMAMNQILIEINRQSEENIHNVIKGCYNTIAKKGENHKKIRALMVGF